MPPLLLLACVTNTPTTSPQDYAHALTSVKEAPAQAAEACKPLADPTLHADCLTLGCELLAEKSPTKAAALCDTIDLQPARDECFFQLAEKSGDPTRCAAAVQFEDDCRMHLWSAGLPRLLSTAAEPGKLEPVVQSALATHGFDDHDLRPWSAAYRWVLEQDRPLDRSRCEAADTAAHIQACKQTGLVVYDDRLNRARDRGIFPCTSPLHPAIAHAPDPEIAALIAARDDLCPQGDG